MISRLFQIIIISSVFVIFLQCTPQKFIDAGIVPNVVPDVPEVLKVSYDGNEIQLGSLVERSLTKNSPTVKYDGNANDIYTLVMIDPDAPTPQNPTLAQYLHWLIVNIPGNEVENGQVLSSYVQPSPPKRSDAHRYIFLVYKQPEFIPEAKYNGGNTHFNVSEYATSHNCQGPLAGFFFYVKQQ